MSSQKQSGRKFSINIVSFVILKTVLHSFIMFAKRWEEKLCEGQQQNNWIFLKLLRKFFYFVFLVAVIVVVWITFNLHMEENIEIIRRNKSFWQKQHLVWYWEICFLEYTWQQWLRLEIKYFNNQHLCES